MQSLRLSLITAMAALIVWVSPAGAQNIPALPDNAAATTAPGAEPDIQVPSEFLIEPDAQIKGLAIKQKTYRSQAVGQNKGWDLDIGRFQGGIDEDPNRVFEDLDNDTYSGMRLRLPFLGGTKK
jgi:hypothetical protein